MKTKPPVSVQIALPAARKIKRMRKKYPHVYEDVARLVEQLVGGETPGDQIPGVGYTVFKVRVQSSDLTKGKSGGYRVIYYIRTADRIILVTIYTKTERVDISPQQIRRLIEEYEN